MKPYLNLMGVLCLGAALTSGSAFAQGREDLLRASQQSRLQNEMQRTNPEMAPPLVTGSSIPAGPSGYRSSSASSRSYDERNRRAAAERSGKLKDFMKKAADTLPANSSDRSKVSTGISDGRWQSDRLARIRSGYGGYDASGVPTERRGVFERLGDTFDSLASNEDAYIAKRRAGQTNDRPLDRLRSISEGESRSPGAGLLALPGALLPGRDRDSSGAADDGAQVDYLTQARQAGPQRSYAQAPVAGQAPPNSAAEAPAYPATDGSNGMVEADGHVGTKRRGFSLPFGKRGEEADLVSEVAEVPAAAPQEPVAEPNRIPVPRGSGLNLPSFSGFGRRNEGGSAQAPAGPLSSDAAYFVVSKKGRAEFHPDGDSLATGTLGLPTGTLVRIEKAGDKFCTVKLPDGSGGLMLVADLRRAQQSEVSMGSGMARSNPADSAISSRPSIPSAPASTPSRSTYYAPKTNVPLPQMAPPTALVSPEAADDEPVLGHGLLPPTQ